MVADFKSASFGKPEGASAYQIIQQDQSFETPEIAKGFRTICTSFEWKPAGGETHAPCAAILKTANAVLVAQYSDAGRDASGRPHTLRIDCLLADTLTWRQAWEQLSTLPPPAEPTENLQIFGEPGSYSS